MSAGVNPTGDLAVCSCLGAYPMPEDAIGKFGTGHGLCISSVNVYPLLARLFFF